MLCKLYAAVIPELTIEANVQHLISSRIEIEEVMRGFFDSGEALVSSVDYCYGTAQDRELGTKTIHGFAVFDGDQDFMLSGFLLPIERIDETEWFWISWEFQWIRDQDHKPGSECELEVEVTGTQVNSELGHYLKFAQRLVESIELGDDPLGDWHGRNM